MDTDFELQLVDSLKSFVRKSIYYSKKAHDIVFANRSNVPAAIAYLQRASAKMSAAEALYQARIDVLESREAEDIFHQFDVFADETITNFATDHSHQWTDIEFNQLMDRFNYSAFALENK